MKKLPAFEVDKKGLEKILARRGKEFAVLELVQNAFDENVTKVSVTIMAVPKSRGYHLISVTDDSPEGFADLSHAYTLFAESKKKSNATLRGRFNIGEKLVLACCRKAYIITTTGTVTWDGDVRSHSTAHTRVGSVFSGEFRMTREEASASLKALDLLIVPEHIELEVNGKIAFKDSPIHTFTATLPTEIADEEGFLRRTKRTTEIELYHPMHDEDRPHLYELGIPVVETDMPFRVNIMQKVPLNTDRDNVTPAYMKTIKALVLSEAHERISKESARGAWVNEALETGKVDYEAVDTILTARYGENRVVRDPSDPEANKLAASKGFNIIEPRSFNSKQWETIRNSKAVLPAGQVTPSPKPYSDEGDPITALDPDEWTKGMYRFADWATEIVAAALNVRLKLTIVRQKNWAVAATWQNPSNLVINLNSVGERFFEDDPGARQLALLIHEMGHAYSGDHLSEEYHDGLCKLGAKLAEIAVRDPKIITG